MRSDGLLLPAPAPTALSPARLSRLARSVAGSPRHWQDLVRYDPDRRWYHLLERDDEREIWLLSWLPGQGTGLHDHGASAGAFAIARGTLAEQAAPAGAPLPAARLLRAGTVRSFGPAYVHDVRNESAAPAVSVHAYSPPLSSMRRYKLASGVLEVTGEDRDW